MVESKDYRSLSKQFLTSNLEGIKTLFYLFDVEKLSFEKCQELIDLTKDSPHIFMFSLPTYPNNYVLTKNCLSKNLGSKPSELTEALKALMCLEDRDAVRIAIADMDPIYLFHILKKNAWQVPETLDALSKISQNLYKVKKSFITSMLSYSLPVRAFTTGANSKTEKNKMVESIKLKISKTFKYNSDETANLFLLCKSLKIAPVVFSEDEEIYLGIEKKVQEVKVHKVTPLEAFF